MKKYFPILLLILLIILSFLSATPIYSSSELKQVMEGNKTSFVDDGGKVRMAADKGYAAVVKSYEGGKLVLERYLDESDDLVTLLAGYSKIKREYNERGKNTEIIYLDVNGSPVVINNGYDTIRRSYNTAGKADTDMYWADGVKVQRKQGYWQYNRVYDDEGRICELRYLD